jgi:microcystin-dependent protein
MSKLGWLTPEDAPGGLICRPVWLPDGPEYEDIFRGALVLLTQEWNYEQHGSQTVSDVAQWFTDAVAETFQRYGERCMPIGAVYAFAGDVLPPNALLCDGSSYNAADYPELYAVIGDTYGGVTNGATYFNVPDMRGMCVIGTGDGPATSPRSLGDKGGAETHTLLVRELPAHRHGLVQHTHTSHTHLTTPVNPAGPALAALAATVANTGPPSPNISAYTGDGDEHNNMQPFIALSWLIVYK